MSGVGGPVAGETASVPVTTLPKAIAVTVTVVVAVTDVVVTGNAPLDAPPFTTVSAGTATTPGLLLARKTTAPSVTVLNVTVPVAGLPPATLVGLKVTAERVGPVAAPEFNVKVALRVVPPYIAEIVAVVVVVTARVATVKLALVAPAVTVTLAGETIAAAVLLASVTSAPPVGAAPVKVTVPLELPPQHTLVRLSDTADRVGPVTAGDTVRSAVCVLAP